MNIIKLTLNYQLTLFILTFLKNQLVITDNLVYSNFLQQTKE